MTNNRRVIDVSKLPDSGMDYTANLWWGNLLLTLIETTMFALLVASYFYVRMNFVLWPPPKVNFLPILRNPLPGLTIPTINLIVIIVSCIPMIVADIAARRKRQRTVQLALLIAILFGIAETLLRFKEYGALVFRWDANAYASVVWMVLGMHHVHLFVETAECVLLLSWAFFRDLDDKHKLDIVVTASYWYWVAAIWIPIYVIVYWGVRFL